MKAPLASSPLAGKALVTGQAFLCTASPLLLQSTAIITLEALMTA